MRILNKYLLALVGVIALTLGACTDSVDYQGATPVEGQGVYFPNTQASAITVDKVSGDFVINVSRSKSEGAFDENLSVTIGEDATGIFTVPSKVSFADGETASKITVNYQNAVDGKKYTITLTATDGTVYANSIQTFTVTYVSPNSEVWEVVTDKGVFVDQMFSMFGVSDVKFTEVKVEKAKGRNKYRIQSVCTNGYFEGIGLAVVFPPDFKAPYIILDGDSYTDKPEGGGTVALQNARWYIAQTKLGFSLDSKLNLKYDTDWAAFGSVACNLSTADGPIPPDSKAYPLGSYDEKKKMFDFGVCYHRLADVGYQVISQYKFQLYLDASLMVPDFDKDYTWEDVTDADGYFDSEVVGEKWTQAVQQAKEDSTFYRFPSLYAKNVALYFNYDVKKGTLTMPKQQLTGLTTFGNDVYVDAIANGTKVDKETNTFTFKLSLYLVDKDGKKTHELDKMTETFLWGQGPLDQLVKGKKIDDYVGTWNVPFTELKSGKSSTSTVNISKADASTLLVTGLSIINGYDDTMALNYDSETGYLEFMGQETNPFQGYSLYIAPLNSVTSEVSLTGEGLTGGLTTSGQLMFLDTPGNEGTYDAMAYLIVDDEGISLATGYVNGLMWQAQAAAAYASTGKFSLSTNGRIMNQSIASKHVRKTELNLKGKPVQTSKTVKPKLSIVPGTLMFK